jgi:cytochrome c553
MNNYNKSIKKLAVISFLIFFTACGPKRNPSSVYMPDMYYPTAYDPYGKAVLDLRDEKESSDVRLFKNNHNSTALMPVERTVPRNDSAILPYQIPDTQEGYVSTKSITTSIFTGSEKDINRGKKLYEQICAACHGVEGNGKGGIVESGAYAGVPNYKDREITVGSVYHVINYGKNMMGNYTSHLNEADRWRVAEYVMTLKNK